MDINKMIKTVRSVKPIRQNLDNLMLDIEDFLDSHPAAIKIENLETFAQLALLEADRAMRKLFDAIRDLEPTDDS